MRRMTAGVPGFGLVLVSVLLPAGCGPDVLIDEAAFKAAAPTRVAVLPFRYVSEDQAERADLKVAALREQLHERFSALHYLHLELEMTDRRLHRAGLLEAARFADPLNHRAVGEALGVDAYLLGYITDLSNLQGGLLFRQEIDGGVRLIDAASGKTLVSIEHRETSSGGLLFGTGQSIEAVEQTIDNSSDIGFIRLGEEWCRSVLKEFPPPPVKPEIKQPRIANVEVLSGSGRKLVPGDVVEAVILAPEQMTATMTLGSHHVKVPMVEEEPGRYVGWYQVAIGDRFSGPLSVAVEDEFGIAGSQVLEDTLIETKLPPQHRELHDKGETK